jgi:hypothetical protein
VKAQLLVVTLGAVAGIFAGKELHVGALETFGLVIVGMFASLFLYRAFAKRSNI